MLQELDDFEVEAVSGGYAGEPPQTPVVKGQCGDWEIPVYFTP